ncbi:hypothetical protein [Salinibacillus xinjiangensis]|uniref:Uncharacterized protein n=1 Tax=Salinibacillus xinjiangensis TaxID=1229268 RepID=A0A6G1X7R9_9BACI|nr:hypothetical protein [Salinibacillus xinjiangensis]MRG87014.1 hypothetical protein [Salinibacillus xinjiangensis]
MTIELGVLISILSIIVAFLGYSLKKTNTVKSDASESAELKAGLDYIKAGVDDIRIDLRANEKQIGDLNERVTRVEESSKQAHKRLDNYEKGAEKHG